MSRMAGRMVAGCLKIQCVQAGTVRVGDLVIDALGISIVSDVSWTKDNKVKISDAWREAEYVCESTDGVDIVRRSSVDEKGTTELLKAQRGQRGVIEAMSESVRKRARKNPSCSKEM